jgi:hypothetical protein
MGGFRSALVLKQVLYTGPMSDSVTRTYKTLDGRVLDLSVGTEEERAYLARGEQAYRDGMPWAAFLELVGSTKNPLLRATGGRVTDTVWNHPLYRAMRDLGDRLGIQQGTIAPEAGDDVTQDPFADEWLLVSAAAKRKGVTVQGLHEAIRRGDVVARTARPGSKWLVVSANSLERWVPRPAKQAAGRAGGKVLAPTG